MVFKNSPAAATALISVSCAFILQSFVNRFHRTYQPWCPYCHPGDGGHEHAEVPGPSGGHGRPVPV